MKDEENGARSYKGQVMGDNMSIQINFKWLLQLIVAVGMVVYGWWRLESRIQELERKMILVAEQIEIHNEERRLAEEQHIQDMESLLKTELNINPLSWQWGKKKK